MTTDQKIISGKLATIRSFEINWEIAKKDGWMIKNNIIIPPFNKDNIDTIFYETKSKIKIPDYFISYYPLADHIMASFARYEYVLLSLKKNRIQAEKDGWNFEDQLITPPPTFGAHKWCARWIPTDDKKFIPDYFIHFYPL